MNGVPSSESSHILGSRGTLPKKGTANCSAIFWPPSVLKILVSAPHCGYTKPLMFSMMLAEPWGSDRRADN